jgi:LysM repeat protein
MSSTGGKIMKIIGTVVLIVLCCNFVIAQEDLYTIQKGDTLEKIAKEKLQDASLWLQLAKYNSISNPNLIKTGQKIVIPGKTQLLIKVQQKENFEARVETLEGMLSQLHGFRRETLFEDNFESRTQMEGQKVWIFPSRGKWGISTLGSRVLEQSDRNAPNSAALVGEKGWSSYVVQVELRIEHTGDAGVFAYWNSSLQNYRLRTSDFHKKLQIAKRMPIEQGRYGNIYLNQTSLHLEDNRWYVFQFEVTTHDAYTYLRGKVWPKGETEPGTWLLEASDHSPERYQSGQAGVWTIKGGTSYRGTKFDNFKVFRNTGVN